MSSPMDSAIGIAHQSVGKGTPITDSTLFNYTKFETASISPAEVQRAIPRLAGTSKSLPAGFVKTGVSAAGAVDVLMCTDVIGDYLFGLMGAASASPTANGTLYDHFFTFPTADEFDLPYFTMRRRVAGLWHEQFDDCRITGLQLTAPAADMVRFTVGMMGITPQVVENADWAISTYLDETDPFLACAATLTSPSVGTYIARNVVIACINTLALDEERYVGSYYPYDLTLGGRVITIQCDIHADATIFAKMAYDSVGGTATAASWEPNIVSDGAFALEVETQAAEPHKLKFEADSANDNIDWIVQPVGVRGADNRQLMRVTGVLEQSAGMQARFTLTNAISESYDKS